LLGSAAPRGGPRVKVPMAAGGVARLAHPGGYPSPCHLPGIYARRPSQPMCQGRSALKRAKRAMSLGDRPPRDDSVSSRRQGVVYFRAFIVFLFTAQSGRRFFDPCALGGQGALHTDVLGPQILNFRARSSSRSGSSWSSRSEKASPAAVSMAEALSADEQAHVLDALHRRVAGGALPAGLLPLCIASGTDVRAGAVLRLSCLASASTRLAHHTRHSPNAEHHNPPRRRVVGPTSSCRGFRVLRDVRHRLRSMKFVRATTVSEASARGR